MKGETVGDVEGEGVDIDGEAEGDGEGESVDIEGETVGDNVEGESEGEAEGAVVVVVGEVVVVEGALVAVVGDVVGHRGKPGPRWKLFKSVLPLSSPRYRMEELNKVGFSRLQRLKP